jgi:general secretion pathway protein G
MKTNRSAAFTLIELLTVIAIIGILAAIIIPTVSRVRQSARRAQCTANLKSIMMAAHLYANDNKNKLPRVADPALGTYNNGTPNPNGSGLIDLLLNYTNNGYPSFYCADVPTTSTVTYAYQNARTDSKRFWNTGYYWLNSNSLTAFKLTAPPTPQLLDGESTRMMAVCIYNISGSGSPHNGNFNIVFADGHIGTLGKGKSISSATWDSQTMLLKK